MLRRFLLQDRRIFAALYFSCFFAPHAAFFAAASPRRLLPDDYAAAFAAAAVMLLPRCNMPLRLMPPPRYAT